MSRVELPVVPLCEGCGACCRSIGLPPFEVANPDLGPQKIYPTPPWYGGHLTCEQLTDLDTFVAMPAELRAAHAKLVRELTADPSGKPCAWLDAGTGRCSHYEYRPAVCRDFVPGCKACVGLRVRPQAGCVWIAPAPPEVWRNPRHEKRHHPDRPKMPPLTRGQRLRKWFRRNVVEVRREGWLVPEDIRVKSYHVVYIRFLPRYEVRAQKWAVVFSRRRWAELTCDGDDAAED